MRTEGYWISPEGKIIEVRDHFEEIRSNPERWGFTKAQESKWKREDRDRVLRDAILRSWIRVRGHREYTTLEIAEFNQDTSFRIKEFLEHLHAWDNEIVEIHEVKTHKHWRENVEFFVGEKHLALLGQSDGISKKSISPGLAEVVMNEEFQREQGFRASGAPEVFELGYVAVLGAETVRRARTITATPPLSASIVMGLNSGFGAQETFDADTIRKDVMKRFPKGGTLVIQKGWFEGTPEDSIRITIENSGTGLSDDQFMQKVEEMARDFVREFRQNSIWLDYYRGADRLEAISFDWKD